MNFRFKLFIITGLIFISLIAYSRPVKVNKHIVFNDESLSKAQSYELFLQLTRIHEELNRFFPKIDDNKLFYLYSTSKNEYANYRSRGKHIYNYRIELNWQNNLLDPRTIVQIIDKYIQVRMCSLNKYNALSLERFHAPEWFLAALVYQVKYCSEYPIKVKPIFPLLKNYYKVIPSGKIPDNIEIVSLSISSNEGITYDVYTELAQMVLNYHAAEDLNLFKSNLLTMIKEVNPNNPNSLPLYLRKMAKLVPHQKKYLPYKSGVLVEDESFLNYFERNLYEESLMRDVCEIKILYESWRESILYAEKISKSDTEFVFNHMHIKDLAKNYETIQKIDALKFALSHQLYALRAQAPFYMRRSLLKIEELIIQLNEDNLDGYLNSFQQFEKEFYRAADRSEKHEFYLDSLQNRINATSFFQYSSILKNIDDLKTLKEKGAESWFSAIERKYAKSLNDH